MPDSVKAVAGITKRLLLIFQEVALGEPRVAHPKPAHCRLLFSAASIASPVEVFAQVWEHFMELVCSLRIPIYSAATVLVQCCYSAATVLLQCCYSAATVLLQCCYSTATVLQLETMESPK
ncbi:hypothetical protein PoB_000532200 [Plakobranchus ocellatus]|uniref:Uncharacterized protein n=1 Tax=Plakobranchus ocellatus TaxID=259542 RepID=A0AAV3Y9N1_9GAST|nr:hypothetical protein PoB_000532200 [Plakobranchus ocellatus]